MAACIGLTWRVVMRRNRGMLFFLLLLALSVAALPAADKPTVDKPASRYVQRWFFLQTNLLVDKNVEDGIALLDRAGKAGYNGVVLDDYKFNIFERMPPNYFKNVARFQEAAKAAGIEIIPTVFPIGYSDGLLTHDPNLAEGVPVQNIPFVVKDGIAVLVPNAETKLANADLEDVQGDRFAGFSLQDDPGKVTFADRETVHHGKVSCRMEDPQKGNSGNCRLSQRIKVRAHACYRFSCWVKTQDLKPSGAFKLLVLGKG